MALLHAEFFSSVLGMMMPADVILPQNTPEGEHYPVLYLLHGMSDDQTAWQRRTSIERYADERKLAVVMPTTHLGWYTDCAHGLNYYTFIAKELPAVCRDLFPKISPDRERTFAAGLSMGGYGALKLGLLDPETFSSVATLSGAVNITATLEDRQDSGLFFNIFGSPDKARGSDNDLAAAAERLAASDRPKPRIFSWCGESDFLLDQNRFMRGHLLRLGYDLTYSESPGDHQWKYWDEQIQRVLDWLPL